MPGEKVNEYFESLVYAMVIGINEYDKEYEAGQALPPDKFPNLECAVNDAAGFRKFLSEHGILDDCIEYLVNDNASTSKIQSGFGKLRAYCKRADKSFADPLVFIFFAGHGWTDEDGDDYLVPYGGKRNELYGTSIKNTQFTQWLEDIGTTRLVVFLDACHSGGVELKGARGGGNLLDVEQLGSGAGRYLFASCSKGQQSYEIGKNGIFTRHLLDILNFESEDLAEEEIITTELLAGKLLEKVKSTAQKLGKTQEPVWNSTTAQGIKLNINVKLREKKREKDKFDGEKRIEFLKKICDKIENRKHKYKDMLMARLNGHVKKNEKINRYVKLYDLFDQGFSVWFSINFLEDMADETCNDLINQYEEIIQNQKADNSPVPGAPSAVTDKAARPPAEPAAPMLSALQPNLHSGAVFGDSQSRRTLAEQSDYYILGEESALVLGPLAGAKIFKLSQCVSKPVSLEEFNAICADIKNSIPDNAETIKVMNGIRERFNQCWEAAGAAPTSSTKDLQLMEMKEKKRNE